MPTAYPHGIMPPGERFPKWQNETGGELVYLGWGRRNYQSNPIPIHSNPGWSYYLLCKGTARFLTDGEPRLLKTHEGFLAGPQRPYGFACHDTDEVEVLTWILRSPPTRMESAPGERDCRFFTFSRDEADRLMDLGRQTRSEIFSGDPLAAEALASICTLVEIGFARADKRSPELNERAVLMRTAKNWMIEHFDHERPVEDLAEYLKLSPMSLHRLMVRETGMAPGRYFRKLKMERCRDLLQHGRHSVKWVAYQMGYKHANDFSRAFREHFGYSPSEHAAE